MLRDFPDVDLAESLCLLLDLETAAPEVVTTALARLDLGAERQAAVLPLVQQGVEARRGSKAQDAGLDAHARKLTRIDREKARSFAEFATFDLALDPPTVATLDGIRDAMAERHPIVQLECLMRLVRLEPNPEQVQQFVDRSTVLLEALEGEQRWPELAGWLSRLRALSAVFLDSRPDVAEVIAANLAGFCTVYRGARLVELAGRSAEGRAAAGAVLEALGPAARPALLDAVRSQAATKDGRAAVQLLCDHAVLVAPALVAALEDAGRAGGLQPAIARVLGFAGHASTSSRSAVCSTAATSRPSAKPCVACQDRHAARRRPRSPPGAQEPRLGRHGRGRNALALPAHGSDRQIRDLLGRREFVLRQPKTVSRLLDRAAQGDTANLQPILQTLVPLRYRFWNPGLVRVARQAPTMLKS